MNWKERSFDRVAKESSFTPDRIKIKTRRQFRCPRLKTCSIINLLVLASVALESMVVKCVQPSVSTTTFGPNVSLSFTNVTNSTVSDDLFTLCRPGLTELNITTIRKFLDRKVPTCSLFSWRQLFPFDANVDAKVGQEELTINCSQILDIKQSLLAIAQELQEFKAVLERYDCSYKYSTKANCMDCMASYTNWLCSSQIDVYDKGSLVKPCLDVCYSVIRSCPTFYPDDDFTHGGHSSFDCPSTEQLKNNPNMLSYRQCKTSR